MDNLCVELFLAQVIGHILVGLLETTHNLMQFYSQNIYNSDMSNFVSTWYLKLWNIKAKQPLSGDLYDVITSCGVE